jgi:hypothetical protein
MQNRIDELKGRLELLRRETGEVEVLIQAYENAQKEMEEEKKKEPKAVKETS